MNEWATHCEECGEPLTPDPDWSDERHCDPCNLVYLHPEFEAEILRRVKTSQGKIYTIEELGERLGLTT